MEDGIHIYLRSEVKKEQETLEGWGDFDYQLELYLQREGLFRIHMTNDDVNELVKNFISAQSVPLGPGIIQRLDNLEEAKERMMEAMEDGRKPTKKEIIDLAGNIVDGLFGGFASEPAKNQKVKEKK